VAGREAAAERRIALGLDSGRAKVRATAGAPELIGSEHLKAKPVPKLVSLSSQSIHQIE
jgi:hypothetical protein